MRKKSFDESWEKNIYGKGMHISKYPYDLLVSLIAKKFYKIPFKERKKIKILDIGCGPGNNSKFLAEQGFDVYGIDGSETAIDHCKKVFREKGLKGEFQVADFLNIPSPENFFDCILDRESIYANTGENIMKIIKQIHSKLKKGGLLISFMYNNLHPDKNFGERLEGNTFHNFKSGDFVGTGKANFIDIKELIELFKDFKIKNIINHSCKEIFDSDNSLYEFAEYIIIAQKV